MALINTTDIDTYISSILSVLPQGPGYTYPNQPGSNYFNWYKGLFLQDFIWLTEAQNTINGLILNINNPDPLNPLLNMWVQKFGLGNLGVFDLSTPQAKANAIALFFRLRHAVTRQQIIDVFAAIGFTVTITNAAEIPSTYGVATYGKGKYGSTNAKARKFTIYISITAINNASHPIPPGYSVETYGVGKYMKGADIVSAQNLLSKIFPGYIRVIFV